MFLLLPPQPRHTKTGGKSQNETTNIIPKFNSLKPPKFSNNSFSCPISKLLAQYSYHSFIKINDRVQDILWNNISILIY